MRHIWADVKRAVFSRSFLLAALGMALCLAIGGFQDLYRLFRMDWPEALFGYHEELFLRCLEGELVVPYTAAFVEDVKSGYLKPYLTRTTVDRYIWGKGLGAALSGGLALAAGMALALFLFWLLCAPVEVYGEWAVPSKCSSSPAPCGPRWGSCSRGSPRTCTWPTRPPSYCITCSSSFRSGTFGTPSC